MIAIYKNIHEATAANTSQSVLFEPTQLPKPTTSRPGSWAKVQTMRQRIDLGHVLHHPDDERTIATIEEQQALREHMNKIKLR